MAEAEVGVEGELLLLARAQKQEQDGLRLELREGVEEAMIEFVRRTSQKGNE